MDAYMYNVYAQAQTFVGILGSTTDGTDDKAMTVMGVLNTLETICSVMEDQAEVCDLCFMMINLFI